MSSPIYKVVSRQQWLEAEASGVFRGSGVDIQDGFIHLSAADQVVETVAKHFAGQDDLLLISVDAEALGDALKWEASRGGALFPHIYGDLPMSAVTQTEPLALGQDGVHRFPRDFAKR